MAYYETGGSRSGQTECGVASVLVVPRNDRRILLTIVNTSDTRISLRKGEGLAVLDVGLPLNAGGGSVVIEPDSQGRIWKGAISAITSGANKNLAWQEDW